MSDQIQTLPGQNGPGAALPAGGEEIEFGQEVSNEVISRLKGVKNQYNVISVVFPKVRPVRRHFFKELGGQVHCFGGECCKQAEKPASLHYVVPIGAYQTQVTPQNQVSYDFPFTLKYLQLSQQSYNLLKELSMASGGNIVGIDILMSCSDEQWQKLSFQRMGEAAWMKDPNWQSVQEAMINTWNNHIDTILGNRYASEQDFVTALQQARANAQNQGNAAPGFTPPTAPAQPQVPAAPPAPAQIAAETPAPPAQSPQTPEAPATPPQSQTVAAPPQPAAATPPASTPNPPPQGGANDESSLDELDKL